MAGTSAGPRYGDAELKGKLRHGIEGSAFTLAFLSPGYMESDWCRLEWRTTEEVHRNRGDPALEYSILPMCWKQPIGGYSKPLWSQSFHRQQSLLSRRYLDISRAFRSWPLVNQEVMRSALEDAICLTLDYLREWYPEEEWVSYHDLEPEIRQRSAAMVNRSRWF